MERLDALPGRHSAGSRTLRGRWRWPALLVPLAAFLAFGLLGLYRYVDGFWLYRGYPPPRDPAFVTQHGRELTFVVPSPALGGRRQRVIVYLPPGYDSSPSRQYPVFYLLHGTPGRPDAFMLTVQAGVVMDTLLAQHRIRPVILVMPSGSVGTFADEEWVNGIAPHSGWETWVARDLVGWVDAHFRTIRSGAGRALGGLSEGGYGSLNIAFHHPGEFRVLQSWSGYQVADNIPAIFGRSPPRRAYNSPAVTLQRVAPRLRANGTHIWFYSGSRDPMLTQNRVFAAELARRRVPHLFFVVDGGHNWRIWRQYAPAAILDASRWLAHG